MIRPETIIADVLRCHHPSIDPETSSEPYHCGDDNSTCWDKTVYPRGRQHVAAEVVKALGLREESELRQKPSGEPCTCGSGNERYEWVPMSRFVTDWKEQQ